MNIRLVKYINKHERDRIEFQFVNFDYIDGNELVAKLFGQKFEMIMAEKIDGIWYSIIKLRKGCTQYDLIWHEDVGNYIYSVQQDDDSIITLEHRLEVIVNELNILVK